MKILVTNDDGYSARGIKSLVNILTKYGEVTVVAPKTHQSGTSMAVTLGFRPIAVRDLGEIDGARWIYVDATPASCVKFAIDNVYTDGKPDLVVSGINHGANAATAACYSGTLGAAEEASLNGIPAIGVSLDNIRKDADFSGVEALFPSLFERIMASGAFGVGTYFNGWRRSRESGLRTWGSAIGRRSSRNGIPIISREGRSTSKLITCTGKMSSPGRRKNSISWSGPLWTTTGMIPERITVW